MNQQMMPFGNQPAGFGQPGSFSPPGGGPPPPTSVNSQTGPPPRQFLDGNQQPNPQQKNFLPPHSMAPGGFMGAGEQGSPLNLGPVNKPPSALPGSLPQGTGPLKGLPNASPGAGIFPPTSQSHTGVGELQGGPSLAQGPGQFIRPTGPAGFINPGIVNNRPSGVQVLGNQQQQHISGPSGTPTNIPQQPRPPFANVSPNSAPHQNMFQSPGQMDSNKQFVNGTPQGPIPGMQQPQRMFNYAPQSQMPPVSGPMPPTSSSMPPVSGPMPPTSSSMPPVSASSPMPPMSGPMPPTSGSMPSGLGSMPSGLGSMPPGPGPMLSGQGPIPPTQSPMPPGPGSIMSASSNTVRPMYPPPPPSSNMNQQNLNMAQQQQLSGPYLHSQDNRSMYSPTQGNYNTDGFGGPPPVQQNNMRYPPVNQAPYQPMNQQYSGLNQNYSGMSSPNYPQPPAQQKSQRKLDPDMLPNPIQVMQDNEKSRSGIFYTDQKGLMPPLVTTNFVTHDRGNCSPRFVRSTTYSVPFSSDLLKQTSVPFALLISPLARIGEGEQPLPIVNMGELGPVRCIRCKAYMSPFMQFIDGGKRFHCVFCKATTEVPGEYFQHLDHTGQRVDRYERPELLLGAYEYLATKDYCRNNQSTEPPAFIFIIDVSYNNVKSGLVHLLCSKMKEIIRSLPRDEGSEMSNMKVGFITYSSSVHFYNIKSCLAAPQMLLVSDVNEMFMPLLDGFLCDPVESEIVIDLLMQEIPRQFADTRDTETILHPAIRAGLEALKASDCAGKLLVFHSSLPIADAPGKLKNRDDRKVLNTDKEKSVLAPQNNSYSSLGEECVKVGCSVDLFIFNNSYVDIATIGEVSRLTGGEIFKYTYFQADIDGERFISDLKRDVSRQTAFDATMRVRTSTGVRPTDFYGHFFMSNTKDIELASIDSDKAVAVEIKHDDKLTEEDGVYIQVALLYTSCGGQRRLRILNLSLNICTQMADLYRTCDLDTLVNYFSKQGIFKLLESSPKQVKTDIMNRCANILACYRKNCANPSSVGQLILPECMKLLPLYVNTLLKSDAFSGGPDMTCDDRSFAMHCVMVMDLTVSVVYFYPRLISLHNIDPDSLESPAPIRCTYEKLQDDGVYLLDNGVHMFMWLGMNAPTGFISNVFGVPTTPQVDTDKTALPNLENPMSMRIRRLIDDVREKRHRSMRLTVLKERDKMEMVFKQYLMEDHSTDGSPSYGDFICHMHSQIRTILS
ncbi:hypothetical protein RUM43_001451 [Polyplax serrata]|uniref:Protein transport protein Sec24C n=1 Tax=Polyplax serrata TaxID=468196 RepID=A0AAN8XQQ3_POLSC